jgi:hypothetical protein
VSVPSEQSQAKAKELRRYPRIKTGEGGNINVEAEADFSFSELMEPARTMLRGTCFALLWLRWERRQILSDVSTYGTDLKFA